MLKNKSDCITVIPQFFSYVENQFKTSIKAFRYDNARELVFKDFFPSKRCLTSIFLFRETPTKWSSRKKK